MDDEQVEWPEPTPVLTAAGTSDEIFAWRDSDGTWHAGVLAEPG
jgi:hypothetical protein